MGLIIIISYLFRNFYCSKKFGHFSTVVLIFSAVMNSIRLL